MKNQEASRKRPSGSGKTVVAILLLLAVLLAVGTGIVLSGVFSPSQTPSEPTEPTETVPEPTVTQIDDENVVLYWNVERAKYQNPETGLSDRSRNPEDNYYHILFAYKGRQSYRRVQEKQVANEIDQLDIMGLTVDENNIVTGVVPVEDVTGGKVANRYYVVTVDGQTVIANSSKTLVGESVTLTLSADTNVYDVSGEGESVGIESTVREGDRIIGILDLKGNVSYVYIIERAYVGPTQLHYCDHCKQEVEWKGWQEITLPTTSGHFYLTEDLTLKAQQSIKADQAVILDLNGKKVTSKNDARLYSLHNEGAYLAIMDYSAEQTGTLAGAGSLHAQGGIVWVRYGLFEMYSGTLDSSKMEDELSGNAVYINAGMTMNFYGGTIIGGRNNPYRNPTSGTVSAGAAGSVYVDGTLNMYGGTIRDGWAATYYDGSAASESSQYTRGLGGNMYISGKGVANISGGQILNGTAGGHGGNIYNLGVLNISGNTLISGGYSVRSSKRGGNICNWTSGKLTMTGGSVIGGRADNGGNISTAGVAKLSNVTVSGGSAKTAGDNIIMNQGTLHLNSCRISGGVRITKTDDLTLSGSTKIIGGKNGNLYLGSGLLANVSQLTDGAQISVTASGIFTKETPAETAKYFIFDNADGDILHVNGALFAGRERCLCGGTDTHESYCDGTELLWLAWTSATTLPNKDDNYYLLNDVQLASRATIGVVNGDTRNVTLDLNGKTVTGAENSRTIFITSRSTLNLCDTSADKTGTIRATGVLDAGHVFYSGSNTTINMYGGTVTGGNVQPTVTVQANEDGTETKTVTNGNGGNAMLFGTLNLYGGVITGGKASPYFDEAKNTYTGGFGGNIYVNGSGAQFNQYGGTVTDGAATKGGGVYLNNGSITLGGSAVIRGNNNGNLFLPSGKTVTVDDALNEDADVHVTLERGYGDVASTAVEANKDRFTDDNGSEIRFDVQRETLYVETPKLGEHVHCVCGGTLESEQCDHVHGEEIDWLPWGTSEEERTSLPTAGNYYLVEDIVLPEPSSGTAVCIVNGGELSLCLNGKTITGPDNANSRRVFHVSNGGSLTITDCSDKPGQVLPGNDTYSANGGLVLVGSKSYVTLYNGTLYGRDVRDGSNPTGGVIASFGHISIYGGTLTGGAAYQGGIIHMSGASSLKIYGGTVTGGTTTVGGAVHFAAGTVTLGGSAKITGNTGGNLYLPSGETVTVDGTLDETADIHVTLENGYGDVASTAVEANKDRFTDDNGSVVGYDAQRKMVCFGDSTEEPEEPAGHVHCACGASDGKHHPDCDGTTEWTVWDGDAETFLKGGNLTLETDVTLKGQISCPEGGDAEHPVVINLCLNGNKLQASEKSRMLLIRAGYTLNICDCSTDETKAGTIQGAKNLTGGGSVMQLSGGKVNQFGGKLVGGKASGNGGAVIVLSGSYNLYDGVVTGGTANLGGNVAVSGSASQFNVYGGRILDGTITNATAGSENVIVMSGGAMVMTGGEIKGGVRVTTSGSKITLSGNARITGSAVSNLALNGNGFVTLGELMEGAKIGITMVGSSTVVANNVTSDVSGFFDSDVTDKEVYWDSDAKALKVREVSDASALLATVLSSVKGIF